MSKSEVPKFYVHASAIGTIMTKGFVKGPMNYVQEFAIEHKYKRTKEFTSKYTEKGKAVEEAAFTLINKMLFPDKLLQKNTERINDGVVSGEMDLWLKDWSGHESGLVLDAKSPWSIFTHPLFEDNHKNYEWQGQGYMRLTGAKHFWLVFCLVDAPMNLIFDEVRKYGYRTDQIEIPDQEAYEVARNMVYTEDGLNMVLKHFPGAKPIDWVPVPDDKRLKKFEYTYDPVMQRQLEERVNECQEYLNEIWHKI